MVERAEFGPFRFELRSGTLSRHGVPVRLQPQPARVLAILVSRVSEVVSRDELRQQIWPTGTFVDFERGLNFAIAHIRAALGDSAGTPLYIETLPKRGYRFIAPITSDPAVETVKTVTTGATVPIVPSESRRTRRVMFAAAAVVMTTL